MDLQKLQQALYVGLIVLVVLYLSSLESATADASIPSAPRAPEDRALRVHVLTIPAHGHYMTTKGIALALHEDGHNVTWLLCDRNRGDYDKDRMGELGLGLVSAGACPVYEQREQVLAAVISLSAGQKPGTGNITNALEASRAMLDGVSQLSYEMCDVLMRYYAADPMGRLPDVFVFDADTYCGMDLSVVWRIPRVARVGTGPRDPYTTPWIVPAYLSGVPASPTFSFRLQNAISLIISRILISPWLLPAVYSRHRTHWLALYGTAGLQAAQSRHNGHGAAVLSGAPPARLPTIKAGIACTGNGQVCLDESRMDATLPWDGIPTLFNSHWGLEYARPMRPFEHMIGHSNDFTRDASAQLPTALKRWLEASEVPVVYVGLGTLGILPSEWLTALGTAMTSSKHFRFVWSIAKGQATALPPLAQLVAARASCAAEQKGSEAQETACSLAQTVVAEHPFLASIFPSPLDILSGTASVGSVYTVQWAPQVAVLTHPAVSVFVTHGGMNGVAEATFARKPVLCMPLFSDQPDNCARLEARGAGLSLAWTDMHGRWKAAQGSRKGQAVLDYLLVQLHSKPSFRGAMESMWSSNVLAGGTPRAVQIIKDIAARPYGAHLELVPASHWRPWYFKLVSWLFGGSDGCADVLVALWAVWKAAHLLLTFLCRDRKGKTGARVKAD